jgi:DNA uptake protein ComE-like DNA-binding protein
MKQAVLQQTRTHSPSVSLAQLSGPHGYRFDSDTLHLNAMFALLDPAAHDRSWVLQLWACASAPACAQDLAGHIVAEVALPPMGELADEVEHFEVSALAWPPAGANEHTMVLVLASNRTGELNEVHDLAVYPIKQRFIQPRMSGIVGYRIDGSRVQIQAERVENPRDATNRSGTLSLELWALSELFSGGHFQGHHLAGAEIGSVNGQRELRLQPMDLTFTTPPTGNWQIVLMLREWTTEGFVTRDFANFPIRFISAPVEHEAAAPVVEKLDVQVAEKADAPPVAKASTRTTRRVIAKEIAKAGGRVSRTKVRADASTKQVSINAARVEELAAVKGLSEKIAARIVKNRPFASLDNLSQIKGLRTKLLAKVRSRLKL